MKEHDSSENMHSICSEAVGGHYHSSTISRAWVEHGVGSMMIASFYHKGQYEA